MRINFASSRLAFFLIASLFVMILISAIVPQQDIALGQLKGWNETQSIFKPVIDWLGLDRIYYTPAFFIVLGLLAINLIFGNFRRFKIIYKTDKTLLKLRHLGSIIFHLSIVGIMAGVILHFLFQYHGVFAITEKQTVYDEPEYYFREFRGPLYTDQYGLFSLRLDSLVFIHPNDLSSTESKAGISLIPVKSKPRTTSVQTNRPLQWNDLVFHYGSLSGYSPEITLSDSVGNELIRTFIRVAHKQGSNEDRYFDYIIFPEYQARIEIEVLPPSKKNQEFEFLVSFYQDSLMAYSGQLALGQSVSFNGYQFTVSRVRRWCYISVIRNPFLGLIFTAFWMALVGMTISFIPRVIGKN